MQDGPDTLPPIHLGLVVDGEEQDYSAYRAHTSEVDKPRRQVSEDQELAGDAQSGGLVTEVDGERGAWMEKCRSLGCLVRVECVRLETHSSWRHRQHWMAQGSDSGGPQ